MSKTKTIKKYTKGGKVIASGGFGCVFNPPLRCKGKQRQKNKVSKLMTERHVLSEYNEINQIKKILETIPNYKDYFLVDDISICEPEKLDSEDLKDFKKKCTALPKKDINENNVNDNLDKLMVLNMPYGGIQINDYIYNIKNYKQLVVINNQLINLLKNGIIPMNKKYVYHTDVKNSNVLISLNNSDVKTRLIDWGITTEYIPNKDAEFPNRWKNRPLQFNVPFSLIIFSDDFVEQYTKYIQDNNNNKIDEANLKQFVKKYLEYWLEERGQGHLRYINKIFYQLFINDIKTPTNKYSKSDMKIIEKDYTINYIVNYIVQVLIHFTKFRKDGSLNLRVYLDTVFIKILDVWGLVMCYITIIEVLFENYKKLNETELKLFNSIKHIILKYLYEPRITPINIDELTHDLKSINELFVSQYKNNKSVLLKSKKNITSKRESKLAAKTPINNTNNNVTRKIVSYL
jgi:hypothetical protein